MDIDIKLVQHAKDYLDELARGINPITMEEVGENDSVNNIKISRCFLYVSDVLGAVIENGGVGKQPKKKTEPFDLQKLDLSGFEFSEKPIPVSAIAEGINALKPEDMKKLKTTALTNWLVDLGMLSIVQINGKNHKRPTSAGEEVGISLEQRDGQYGVYYVVLYNESAQHFIVDNLSAVIDRGYN